MIHGGNNTRFIAFAEWDPKDLEQILAKQRDVIDVERAENPEQFPTKILPDHFLGGALPQLTKDGCTLAFYESSDPEQLMNIANRWSPLIKFTFVPIFPGTASAKSWLQMQKR